MIGLMIFAAAYIGVCELICNMFEVTSTNKKFLVYAIVSSVGGFLLKAMLH